MALGRNFQQSISVGLDIQNVLENSWRQRDWEETLANLKDLAQSLGLSITTVSRALDGYSDVSPKTRERVELAAAAAGYRPNASARRLRRKRAEVVAVILPTDPGHLGPPVFLDLLGACAETLAEENLNLILAPVPRGQNELDLCRRLVDGHRVDAVIVVRTRKQDERVDFLQSRDVPFVTHGRTMASIQHAYLDGDGETGFLDATRRLILDGHRRIAHVAASETLSFAGFRKAGWTRAMREADLEPVLLAEGSPSERGGYEAALALLGRGERPTAIVSATDEMAIGVLRALQENGLEAGRDIALVGHDNLPGAAFTRPALSTMQIAAKDSGARLGSLLLRRIAGERPEDLQEILPVEFVARDTHRWIEGRAA